MKTPAVQTRARKPSSPLDIGIPDADSVIGFTLRKAQLAVFQDFGDRFARLKVRPAEFTALTLMASRPGQKQSDIAEALGVKPANLVSLMDGLEKRGLAERRKGDVDRRSHSLHLTPKGEKFVERMLGIWRQHEDYLVAKLGGEAERDRLIEMLERITAPDPDNAVSAAFVLDDEALAADGG
ncbi:MAG: winged helix-turn-helix transcriptional regulator [Notoacmeibacter sp.]|nr:winged helix-turn-helix transcriptional regulator [Notoacmeibacter sp.]